MKIVVNDIAASFGGALTILRQFYDYVRENDHENEWIFLLSDDLLEEAENIKIITLPQIKKSSFNKIIFDCITGRRYISNLHPDVVLSMQNIITFGVKVPQAVYVHQSIPFQEQKKFSFLKKDERGIAKVQYIIGAFIKKSVQKADEVFVQTEWMKEGIYRKARIPESKITTVFPKVRQIPSNFSKFDGTKFFYPTNPEIYKNISTLVKACDLLDNDGIQGYKVYLTLPQDTKIHNNIQCVGRLNTEEMQAYYQTCTLLFPSYIETVGLPLLEARSCGTMIIASDTPFSHECLDGYENASFHISSDAHGLYEKMKSVINGKVYPIKEANCNHRRSNGEWDILYKKMMLLRRKMNP